MQFQVRRGKIQNGLVQNGHAMLIGRSASVCHSSAALGFSKSRSRFAWMSWKNDSSVVGQFYLWAGQSRLIVGLWAENTSRRKEGPGLPYPAPGSEDGGVWEGNGV